MKKSKNRLFSVLTISLVSIFAVACLVGFSACGLFDSDDDDDHVHTVTSWELEEPTCEEDGSQTGTCDICGDAVMLIIPATGHDYVYEVTEEATCEEDGLQTGVCSKCGDIVTETIPAMGHNYVYEITKEATCEEDGSRTGECSVCGDTVTETIPATGHTWDEGTVTKEATEDEEGEMTYTCTVCGETKTEKIDKLENDEGDGDGDDDNPSVTPDPNPDDPSGGDDGDEGDEEEEEADYSRFATSDGEEYARVAGTADTSMTQDGNAYGELNGVKFEGSSTTATLSEDGAIWVISGTSAKMTGEQAKAFYGEEDAEGHVCDEYLVFAVYAAEGEMVTVTDSNGMSWNVSGATDLYAALYRFTVDITETNAASWYMTVSIADTEGNELYEYKIVLGDIAPDYSYVTDVDGNYARIAGSADEDGFSGSLTGVKFEDSSVNATLGEDGKTWTVSGMSGTMTEEQSKAFWVDETIAADHVGHKYIVFTVYAGKGEVVTMTTSDGKSRELSGATSENVYIQNWIADVTDVDDSWYMLVTVSNDNGDTLYEYTVVLGEIQSYCEVNGHSWDADVVTEPTCTENGYTTQTCSVCGATQEINEVAASGHDYAETWDWSAESGDDGYEVSATLTLVCSTCGEEQVVDSAAITPNSDGTYTGKITLSGVEYTDTRRVFHEGEDGVLTDVGMGSEYTPQKSGDEIASYVLTKVSDSTINLVVAGYANGLSVSVGQGGNSAAAGRICGTSLESVVFEEGVTSIADYAFAFTSSDSPALKSIEFCGTITEIGKYCFTKNSGLVGSLEIPSTLTNMGSYAFSDCTNLEYVTIYGSSSTTYIQNYAFKGCNSLKMLTIDGGKVCIGCYAFQNITTLECVKIYGSIAKASGAGYAFDSSSFSGCTSLSTLIILGGLSIGNPASNAFSNCPLDTVYFEGTESQWSTVKSAINKNSTFITDDCAVYYYSEEYAENCWHWGEDGMPVMWDEDEP